jgi:hypothetical protein
MIQKYNEKYLKKRALRPVFMNVRNNLTMYKMCDKKIKTDENDLSDDEKKKGT